MREITFFVIVFLHFTFLLRSQDFSETRASGKQLSFKENKGQVSDQNFKPRPDVLFSGTDGKIMFHLKANGISYQLNRADKWAEEAASLPPQPDRKIKKRSVPGQKTIYRIDINWLNANTNAQVIQGNVLPGFENYYGEACPNGALSVKNYEDVTYKDLYPGIDLKWYEKNDGLEYDFIVSAFADYTQIRLEYSGAEKIWLDKNGELMIQTPLGTITEQKPLVMQDDKKLDARWVLKNNIISFDIKNADSSRPMVIDPMVRLWGTYYGGAADDYAYALNTDNLANVYMCGTTQSPLNIATSGAFQTVFTTGGAYEGDAFVVKFNPAGVRQWATYYGGIQDDYFGHCTVDANGDIYLVGATSTTNSALIATPGTHQSMAPGNTTTMYPNDAFMVKLNSSGVRLWGTYYGGSSCDWASYVDVNSAGDILVAGGTMSSNGTSIATAGCHQPVYGGGSMDGFLVKFNAAGVRQWSTYYGGNSNGSNSDSPNWCSFDASGDIYLSGHTTSTIGISTSASHQPAPGGNFDAFLIKFSSAGVRQWGTYYGGPGIEYLGQSAVDGSGNVYLAGTSAGVSTVISTPGCHQFTYGGGLEDGMFIKFNSSGVRQWGTYCGGPGYEYCGGTSIDPSGNIYFTGTTSSQVGTGIATPCAYQSMFAGGNTDLFIEKFTPAGARLWGSYFGSIYTDESTDFTVDLSGNIYLSGYTFANSGTVIATQGAHQTTYGGMIDAFLQKFDGCVSGNAVNLTPSASLLICPGESVTLTATCGNWYSTATSTNVLSTGGTFTTGVIASDSTFYVEDFGCGSVTGPRTAVSVTVVTSNLAVSNSNTAACIYENVSLTASGASSYTWTAPFTTSVTSVLPITVFIHTVYSVTAVDAHGCVSTATLLVSPNLCDGINENVVKRNIALYPNPNTGIFYIESLEKQKLVLTNELGQEVRKIELHAPGTFKVEIRDLPGGVYFLKGEKDYQGMTKKVVVIH